MDEPFITAPIYPPSILLTGIVVNSEGRRFVAEDSYHSRTSQFVMEQPGSEAYLIIDSEHGELTNYGMPRADDRRLRHDRRARDRARPARAARSQASLDRYNEHAANGEDPDFHKAAELPRASRTRARGRAFDLRLGKAIYAGFTLGGIRVTVDGQAQRPDGSVIAGLYAAGACASNIAQDGKGYCSGTQLGEGSFFGRRAGRHAAGVSPGSR